MEAMILEDRERRQAWLEDHLSRSKVVLTLRANYPGQQKNTEITERIIGHFDRIICRLIPFTASDRWMGPDGLTILYHTNIDARNMKKMMVEIEEEHPIGRFVDIDVYDRTLIPISRTILGYEPRRCYLCERFAHDCVRSQRHPLEDILQYIEKEVTAYVSTVGHD